MNFLSIRVLSSKETVTVAVNGTMVSGCWLVNGCVLN